MKRALVALCLLCCGCAATPQAPELLMTVAGDRDECLLTLDGEQFVTHRLESVELLQRLREIRGRKVALWFAVDAPYRCAGSAIITLQQAKIKFRIPQIPAQ